MKTISNLIREIFAAHRTDKDRSPVAETSLSTTNLSSTNQNPSPSPSEETEGEIKNPNAYETKSDETPRDPELDNPDAGEDPRDAQEPEEPGFPQSDESRTDEQRADESRTDESNTGEERIKDQRTYEEGVVDGRNAVIEETYFPKEDGVPHFRGNASRNPSCPDIFSLAREA